MILIMVENNLGRIGTLILSKSGSMAAVSRHVLNANSSVIKIYKIFYGMKKENNIIPKISRKSAFLISLKMNSLLKMIP